MAAVAVAAAPSDTIYGVCWMLESVTKLPFPSFLQPFRRPPPPRPRQEISDSDKAV